MHCLLHWYPMFYRKHYFIYKLIKLVNSVQTFQPIFLIYKRGIFVNHDFILFKVISIFLGLNKRDASLMILYLAVIGIISPKIRGISLLYQYFSNRRTDFLVTIMELLRFLNRS